LQDTELRVNVHAVSDPGTVHSIAAGLNDTSDGIEAKFLRIAEARVSLGALGIGFGQPVKFQLSLWQAGLPMDALPAQGWIEVATAESVDWML
jgi:hypothetical protein